MEYGIKNKFVDFSILIKIFFIGFFTMEFLFIGKSIGTSLHKSTIPLENINCGFLMLIFLSIMSIIIFSLIRGAKEDIFLILQSKRFDILATFLLGLITPLFYGGIISSISLSTKVISFDLFKISLLLVTSLTLIFNLRSIFLKYKKKKIFKKSFFLGDIEKKEASEDLLNYGDFSKKFAKRVINNFSNDNLVFGIDAPWGIGKSTFLNFCIEEWENNPKYKNRVIVYKFNPLHFGNRRDLLEHFMNGLITTLKNYSYIPEIKFLISKYSSLILKKKSITLSPLFSFFKINFDFDFAKYTVEDALKDIKETLSNSNRRVIIIVDDLDRINNEEIKDILFTIKKSFNLPSISYVLCYDTENIIKLNNDIKTPVKTREFLEKFINVKISLYPNEDVLVKFVSHNIDKLLKDNCEIDEYKKIKIKELIIELKNIYKSTEFHKYQPFISDIRKIKRFINTIMLLEIEETDFQNNDFNPIDLIHLVLIYINYPDIFRKIYNTETGSKRGFFSLISPLEDGYPKTKQDSSEFKNSIYYEDYIEGLDANQRFLVNKLFSANERFKDTKIDSIDDLEKRTFACFNGTWGTGRNLEEYLKLIVDFEKPARKEQYKFYLNKRNEIVNGKDITEIFQEKEFKNIYDEGAHRSFWDLVNKTAYDFSTDVGTYLINSIIYKIKDYSLVEIEKLGLGLRRHFFANLVRLVNTKGWNDPYNNNDNSEENIVGITDLIFGENKYKENSLISQIASTERGVLGLYDLIGFRLYCCSDRGGEIYNISRALYLHGNPKRSLPSTGVVDEMRKLSQDVFLVFKNQYINQKKNIFTEIDAVSQKELLGNYNSYLEDKIKNNEITQTEVNEYIEKTKNLMKSFIIYQLSNNKVSHGVGCGFYDPQDASDVGIIHKEMNDYLFKKCFFGEENYEYFLNYLIINMTSVWPEKNGKEFIFDVNNLKTILDINQLKNFWDRNQKIIKGKKFEKQDKTIYTYNYTFNYRKDLLGLYEILDNLSKEEEK